MNAPHPYEPQRHPEMYPTTTQPVVRSAGPHDSSGKSIALIGVLVTVIGSALALFAWLYPKSPDPSTTSLNERAPYLMQVDGICHQFKPAMIGLGPPPTEPDEGMTWFGQQARLHRALLTAWANLQIPVGDDELVRTILDPLEQEVMQMDLVVESLQRGHLDDANAAIVKVNEVRTEYRSAARAYGLRVCHDL